MSVDVSWRKICYNLKLKLQWANLEKNRPLTWNWLSCCLFRCWKEHFLTGVLCTLYPYHLIFNFLGDCSINVLATFTKIVQFIIPWFNKGFWSDVVGFMAHIMRNTLSFIKSFTKLFFMAPEAAWSGVQTPRWSLKEKGNEHWSISLMLKRIQNGK